MIELSKSKVRRYASLWSIVKGGDMATYLKNLKRNRETIPEETVWRIFMQLVLALHEIHRRKEGKILHRDIKPANVFLDAQNNIKLGDFGLSKMLTEESAYAYTNVGTPYYMSPEQINDNKYNEKSDIWASGCFLHELCTFNPPFEASNHLALALKIKNGKFDKIPENYSEELQRVISWTLSKKHEERPNVDDLLNIPYISRKLREKRLKDNKVLLKKREDDIKQRENDVLKKETDLKAKEETLKAQEKILLEQEEKLRIAEDHLKNKENASLVGNYGKVYDRQTLPNKNFEQAFKERKHNISKTVNISNKYQGTTNILGFNNTFERNSSIVDSSNNNTRTYHSIDRGDETADISYSKLSKQPSFKEEMAIGEGTNNTEISNILKHIERIRVESSDEEEKVDRSTISEHNRQPSGRLY